MNRKAVFGIVLIVLTVGVSPLMFNPLFALGSSSTTLHVDPPSIVDASLAPGSVFTVDVVVSDVEYLYSWQVNMSFDPSVLEFVNVTEGDFLMVQPEGTYGAKRIENEEGWAFFGWTTIGAYVGVSGSGTLATIEFEVLAEGESTIGLAVRTILYGQDAPSPPPNFFDIPFTAEDGYFNNLAAPSVYELIESVESWHLHRGTERSLVTKLKVAGHMLDMEKEDGAIRKLTAFVDRVQILRGKTLTDEQADYLVSEAQGIMDSIQG